MKQKILQVGWLLLTSLILLSPGASAQSTWDVQFEWLEAPCNVECGRVDGYRISIEGGGVIADTAEAVTSTIVSDYALNYGETYCFTVEAYNAAGGSGPSPAACISVPNQSVPGTTTLTVQFATGS